MRARIRGFLPWDTPSAPLAHRRGFRELLLPGCFGPDVGAGDVRLLLAHNPAYALASTLEGTLRLEPGPHGLRVTADLAPADREARALALALRTAPPGAFGLSPAFVPVDVRAERRPGGVLLVVRRAVLRELSITPDPAFRASRVALVRDFPQPRRLARVGA